LEIEEKEREAAKKQAVSATNEIQTFGYRQPVFPQMPSKDDINRDEQKQRERSPLKVGRKKRIFILITIAWIN
jgi:hypothetical protein